MSYSLWVKTVALLIAHALTVSTFTLAQEPAATPQTRPRRVGVSLEQQQIPPPPPLEMPTPVPAPVPVEAAGIVSQPVVRVGLATDARSVTISTTGNFLNATDESAPPVPLLAARLRIEPRLLPSPSPPAPAASPDTPAATKPTTAANAKPAAGAPDTVRLVSRLAAPTRAAVVYAATSTTPILQTRAPVVFASDDEAHHPVRFREKPYRGRLEVFTNPNGTLTVVNVIGLEDYVRGVVPNELSPGGYPAIEALKAQAVAARTYAVSNRGRFAADGFDVLPTTRSQVYGGQGTEHPLTDRAVAETRGVIATFHGETINALYTSTCGGRTEHGENIFGGETVPYLRGRECAVEGKDAFAPFTVRSSREPLVVRDAAHASSARDAALLALHGFALPGRITDEWLAAPVTSEEVRAIMSAAARLARRPLPSTPSSPSATNDVTRAPAFSSALATALDGESRADVLLNQSDVDYHLAFRDAGEIPAGNRADVALFLRDGHLALYPDATLRPRQPLTRARALHAAAHLLEARDMIRLQKATARPSTLGALVLRPGKGPERPFNVSSEAYLFRAFGENLYPVREVTLIGGEPISFHLNARGEVDYLEVRPAANGAASDRFSPFTNWSVTLAPSEVARRLGRVAESAGTLLDLRVVARGSSRRVLDLQVTGTSGTAHVRGGRIRSALGLREQLFVIDRVSDEHGRLTGFVFTGRGWGHGVGMCQVGAYGLARAGWNYERILKAYYTGIELTKLY